MQTETYHVKLIFLTEILGSQPTREVASEFIAAKNGYELAEDEAASLPEALERGTTVFYRYPGTEQPAFRDYQIKGFLKEAGRVGSGKQGLPKNLRSKIDNLVFVAPRWLRVTLPAGEAEVEYLERPLRAETAQGPRVALVRSEMLPEGCVIEFGLEVLPGEISENVLRELLDYGFYKGLGQWRNGGYGRFRYELTKEA